MGPTIYVRREGQVWTFYRDPCAQQFFCRWSDMGPQRRSKFITLNCVVYKLVWLTGDLPESPIPHPSDQLFAAST